MKKVLAFACVAASMVSGVRAESPDNYLFPTAILGKGEVDASVSIRHDTHTTNINFRGNPGEGSLDLTAETLQARYGLGADWDVGASLHYASLSASREEYRNPPANFLNSNGQGLQNPSLWVRYGFINDSASRLSLSGEILATPNTTGKAARAYAASMSAGWQSSETLKLYGTYALTSSRDQYAATISTLSVGAYQTLSESLTLVPHAHYSHFQATSTFDAQSQVGFGLSADIRLSRGYYLIPTLDFYRNSAGDSADGLFHRDAMGNGKMFQLSWYHLF